MGRLVFVLALVASCGGDSQKPCATDADCPGDRTCTQITCSSHVCHYRDYANQSASPAEQVGDCKQIICDGSGGYFVAVDMVDRPPTTAVCQLASCDTDGTPSVMPAPIGMACGGGLHCDAAGACVGCAEVSECPGSDTQCQQRTCDNEMCGTSYAPAGTKLVSGQTKGDCKSIECNGSGEMMTANDDTDVPTNTNECVSETCSNGNLVTTNAAPGTSCGTGLTCNGNGICGECDVPSDCPGAAMDDLCRTHTCTNHVCGTTDATDGTSCADSTAVARCRSGACVAAFDVVRAGDGTNMLSTAAAQVQLEERYASDGALIGAAIALPTAVTGANDACTLAGLASTGTEPALEGFLARSADEHHLTLACYNAAPLTVAVESTSTATTSRVVAKVDVTHAIDTTTHLASFPSVRSAVSTDGTSLWIAGSGGVGYSTLGGTTAISVAATPASVIALGIVGSQLYGSSDAADSFPDVFAIGSGEPTTGPQTCTALPGMPTGTGATNQPLDFAVVTVGATQTLYVADGRSAASSGGIEKWTFDGTTWHLITTFDGLPSGAGMFALTAYVSGTTAVVLAVSNTPTGNVVVSYTDDGASTPAPTTLATAPANTGYRGIALAPH